jgi:hypothetical protein
MSELEKRKQIEVAMETYSIYRPERKLAGGVAEEKNKLKLLSLDSL